MRRLLKALLILVVFSIVAIAALVGGAYWYITNNDVKDILATAVKRTTGHDLYIMGEANLTLFPKPTLMVTDVRIPAFNGDTPIFTAQKLDVAAKWGTPPFIWKGIALTNLTAEEPTVFLKENKKGLANWESPVRGREGFSGASSGGGSNSIDSIGTIALNNATITYEGDKSGTNVNVKGLNLKVKGEDLANTKLTGSGKVNGQSLTATGTINMQEDARPTHITVNAAGATVKFEGTTGEGTPQGNITLSGNNLRQTLAKFVEPAAVSSLPSQNFTVSTSLEPAGKTTHLKNLQLELGNVLNFKGAATHEDRGNRSPMLTLNGTFNTLNLNALNVCGQTSNNTTSTEWDATPIDLSFIRTMNWHIQLNAASLNCADAPINSFRLNAENDGLTVKINSLTANFPKNGKIDVDGTVKYGNRILANLNTNLTTLPIEAFMTHPGDLIFPLSGILNLNLEGVSTKAMMESLEGTAILSAQNATLPAKKLETLAGKLSSIIGGGSRTATADFNARYDINKGLAETQEFNLKTQDGFLSVTGEGKIDIGHRAISYKLTPKATTNGGLFKGGLAVPVTIQGRWHNLKVRPDSAITTGAAAGIGAAVGGPAGAAIGAALGSVASGDKDAVGNLIQGVGSLFSSNKEDATTETAPASPETQNPEDQVKDAVQGLIKGLF